MDENKIREALDSLEFSPDFQERAIRLMTERAQCAGKEKIMTIHKTRNIAIIAAAVILALAISVSAAVILLTPAQLARELDKPELAEAFETAEMSAQTAEVNGYQITFAGLASGEHLTEENILVNGESVENRTYAVFAIQREDGEPLPNPTALSELDVGITPLVYGYLPWTVNIYSLGGAYTSITRDGVAYFLFSMDSLEQYPAEDVIFAAYEGFDPPSAEKFTMAEDGTISLNDGIDGVIFKMPQN